MHDWHSLSYQGDQWFVSYTCVPPSCIGVTLFSVGHAIELYLKASHTKIFGDFDKAIAYGHKVKDLWDSCKAGDRNFLPNHDIRDNVFRCDFFDRSVFNALSKDDQLHFIKFQCLYIIAKHLQDIKYLGLPWKTRKKGQMSFGSIHPDPYWITLFKDMRNYLGYPLKNKADFIEQVLSDLPANSAKYLRDLYAS